MIPDKDFNLTVGLRIREIRESLALSRAAFSEKCDLSESFLAAVENGAKSITSKTLYKICTTYNISPNYLILGNDEGFEVDGVIEIINSMDDTGRESALKILRAYIQAMEAAKE